MAGETVITVVGNLTDDPKLPSSVRRGRRELHDRVDAPDVRPPDQ